MGRRARRKPRLGSCFPCFPGAPHAPPQGGAVLTSRYLLSHQAWLKAPSGTWRPSSEPRRPRVAAGLSSAPPQGRWLREAPAVPGTPARSARLSSCPPGPRSGFLPWEGQDGRRVTGKRLATSGGVLAGRGPCRAPEGGTRSMGPLRGARSLGLFLPHRASGPWGAVRGGCPSALAAPRPPRREPRSRTCGAPCTYPRGALGLGALVRRARAGWAGRSARELPPRAFCGGVGARTGTRTESHVWPRLLELTPAPERGTDGRREGAGAATGAEEPAGLRGPERPAGRQTCGLLRAPGPGGRGLTALPLSPGIRTAPTVTCRSRARATVTGWAAPRPAWTSSSCRAWPLPLPW